MAQRTRRARAASKQYKTNTDITLKTPPKSNKNVDLMVCADGTLTRFRSHSLKLALTRSLSLPPHNMLYEMCVCVYFHSSDNRKQMENVQWWHWLDCAAAVAASTIICFTTEYSASGTNSMKVF